MKKTIIIILIFAIGILIGWQGKLTHLAITGEFPKEYFNKYTVCPKCNECVPYAKITGGKLYCDSKPYLDTIKSLNFKVSDLKSCLREECLNFSSMSSKCN